MNFEMTDEYVSRRAVRHLIVRARNARIAAEERDDRWPLQIVMAPSTLSELQVDGDPQEAHTLDFEGLEFMGIPLVADPEMLAGEFELRWPAPLEPTEGVAVPEEVPGG